jgi:hypothetical protein
MLTEGAIVSGVFIVVPSQLPGILIIFATDGTSELLRHESCNSQAAQAWHSMKMIR